LKKRKELGYSTLVAEGTTVAIGLVEEVSIDAVIGVSCMPCCRIHLEPFQELRSGNRTAAVVRRLYKYHARLRLAFFRNRPGYE
jgi:hypothetical protein